MSDLYTFDADGMRRIAAAVRDFERQLKNLSTQSPGQRGTSMRTHLVGRTLSTIERGSPAAPHVYTISVLGRAADGSWAATDETRTCEEIGLFHEDMPPVAVGTLCYQIWCNGAWIYLTHEQAPNYYCWGTLDEDLDEDSTATLTVTLADDETEVSLTIYEKWGTASEGEEIGVLWNGVLHRWEGALQRCD